MSANSPSQPNEISPAASVGSDSDGNNNDDTKQPVKKPVVASVMSGSDVNGKNDTNEENEIEKKNNIDNGGSASSSGSILGDNEAPVPPALERKVSLQTVKIEQQVQNRFRHDRQKSLTQAVSKDNPPATRREIWSWYCNDSANSVYPNVGLLLCLPLLLTELATLQGCKDLTYGCDYEGNSINNSQDARVYFLGWEMRPASFAAYMVSMSGFFQAIIYIGVGPVADFTKYRKLFLIITSVLGSVGTMSFVLFWDPSTYWFAGVWLIVTNVLYGLSLIFYYAYLPILVEVHWDVLEAIKNHITLAKMEKLYENLSSSVSQRGFAAGFIAGLLCLLIGAAIIFLNSADNFEINETNYGKNFKSNEFDELWAQYVSTVNIWYYDDNDDYSQITAIQFEYANNAQGSIYGTPNSSNENISISSGSYDCSSKSDYISKINIWLDGNISSIAAIQFDDSEIFGNPNASFISNTMYSNIKSTQGSNYVLAGLSGSLTDATLINNDGYKDELEVVSSLSFVWRDKTLEYQTNTDGYRIAIFVAGVWWLLLFYFPAKYLLQRPGPPFPKHRNVWLFGFEEVFRSIKESQRYPNLFIYLISFFMFSDGLNTLATTSVLFGSEELGMTSFELVILVILTQLFAFIGTFFFLKIETKYGLTNKQMLSIHLAIFVLIPIYALFGFFAPFGLTSKYEMFAFSFVYGINVGSIQSYARSLYSQLIPVGRETEFFSLYQITDKGSSWIGPLVVAVVSNSASIRWALIYVLFFFVIPLPLVYYKVNMEIGRIEAGRDLDQMLGRVSIAIADVLKTDDPLMEDMRDVIKSIDNLGGAIDEANENDNNESERDKDAGNENENEAEADEDGIMNEIQTKMQGNNKKNNKNSKNTKINMNISKNEDEIPNALKLDGSPPHSNSYELQYKDSERFSSDNEAALGSRANTLQVDNAAFKRLESHSHDVNLRNDSSAASQNTNDTNDTNDTNETNDTKDTNDKAKDLTNYTSNHL